MYTVRSQLNGNSAIEAAGHIPPKRLAAWPCVKARVLSRTERCGVA
jgi:hypothetical protein